MCAVDAVTFALIAKHRPDAVAGLSEIARTPAAPGLPLITSGSSPDDTLEALGIEPSHLAATGFGEHHPLQEGDSASALAANRRIEIKLTSR